MKNFEQLAINAWKKSNEIVSSIQRQAPGARMIGEFAVKQISKETEKLAGRLKASRLWRREQ